MLDRKKLAAFSALGGGFLPFPIGDRRCKRTRASVGNAGRNARPSLTNAILAASRLLHRRSPTAPCSKGAGSREPADRGGVDGHRSAPHRPASRLQQGAGALPGADGASSCAGVRSECRAPWLACGPRRSGGPRAENAANFFRSSARQRKQTRPSPPLARRLTRPRKRSAAMKRSGEWRSSMLTARLFAKL